MLRVAVVAVVVIDRPFDPLCCRQGLRGADLSLHPWTALTSWLRFMLFVLVPTTTAATAAIVAAIVVANDIIFIVAMV